MVVSATVGTGATVWPQLVHPVNFLFATRDTGYKSTGLAIAELVDNSLQAAARSVWIDVIADPGSKRPGEIRVIDDGAGMDERLLAQALTFGGTSRFGDRSSLGRYGMGLPNGALSRCRRVEVITWRGPDALRAWLDIDEVAATGDGALPPIEATVRPAFTPDTGSGTIVRLTRCDRIEYKRASTLVKRLRDDLGRIYRHFLADGVGLHVNEEPVVAVDPLCLQAGSRHTGGARFGDDLTYQLAGQGGTGTVRVRFSTLPIESWHALPPEQKRAMGITAGPPVSVVRAGREIDRGWLLMGDKRRENYDDWWRCEIAFDPALDELFGLTHAKQTITPRPELVDVLAPDLEVIARALNAQARHRFQMLKAVQPLSAAERQAARVDGSLPPLPRRRHPVPDDLQAIVDDLPHPDVPYRIVPIERLPTPTAYEVVVRGGQTVLLLNTGHPWYRDLYGPLALSESDTDRELARRIALTLLAAACVEAVLPGGSEREHAERFRRTWGNVLATFFNA